MLDDWRRQWRTRRVKPGHGRPLRAFRWWQQLGRALFYLRLPGGPYPDTVYAVDVRHWGNQSGGEVKAHLYRDGLHHAESKIPACFPVPGGAIEVAMSGFGIKRCHYVTDHGESQLIPDPRSAEGKRARLQRAHPTLSRFIGLASLTMLVIGLALLLLQVAEPLSRIPPVAEAVGVFHSPVQLPTWLNIALGVGAAVASTERALRLRYSWLDSAGN